MSLLLATAIGNLGRDPEMSYTPSSLAVTKFSLAINTKKGDKETTTWLNCVAFGKPAETLNSYLHKGDMLFVQGSLEERAYTTKDGRAGKSLELTVDKFMFLSSKKGNGGAAPRDEDIPLDLDNDHPF